MKYRGGHSAASRATAAERKKEEQQSLPTVQRISARRTHEHESLEPSMLRAVELHIGSSRVAEKLEKASDAKASKLTRNPGPVLYSVSRAGGFTSKGEPRR